MERTGQPATRIDSYPERAWRKAAGAYRAAVIDTATEAVLYVTWPYAREQAARDAAARWLRDDFATPHTPPNEGRLFT